MAKIAPSFNPSEGDMRVEASLFSLETKCGKRGIEPIMDLAQHA